MMELIKKTNFDFMRVRNYAFAVSIVLVLLGLFRVFQIYRGNANLGIDLAGGTSIQLKFAKPVSTDAVLATAASAAGIVGYLAWRFDFKFGVAATIATFHDVFAMVGMFYL